ncbi:MAG TPA: SGNH/GDSL hydrolase family protein [Ktedonobacterales bacterium]|jgi:lysophospholipase L1-like esterase
MRTILCYGDSNTWGSNPATGARWPADVRWPGMLARSLGAEYRVIEEGLPGRTTVWDDPFDPDLNGKTYLGPCLRSHAPLDVVVIMLGTNDLKAYFARTATEIAMGAGVLVKLAQRSVAGPDGRVPYVALLAPPPVGPLAAADEELLAGAVEKSRQFGTRYRQVAEGYGCAFLDTGAHAASSAADGVHLDADAHQALGQAVAQLVATMYPA